MMEVTSLLLQQITKVLLYQKYHTTTPTVLDVKHPHAERSAFVSMTPLHGTKNGEYWLSIPSMSGHCTILSPLPTGNTLTESLRNFNVLLVSSHHRP